MWLTVVVLCLLLQVLFLFRLLFKAYDWSRFVHSCGNRRFWPP